MHMIIISAVFMVFGALCLGVAFHQHLQNGYVFTNRWIDSTKKQRERMDPRIKQREYRLARNIFFLAGLMFVAFSAGWLFDLFWLEIAGFVLTALACVVAIVQSVINARFYNSLDDNKE